MRQATSPTAIGAPQVAPTKKDTAHWLIQAGISKNWFGIGNTALYGEYGVATDWGAEVRSQLRWQQRRNLPDRPNAVCSQPCRTSPRSTA